MASTLQSIISDQFRLYGLKSDGSIYVASAIEPLTWSPIAPYTGSGGQISSIAVARTSVNDPSLSLYVLASDGTLSRYMPSNKSWYRENTP